MSKNKKLMGIMMALCMSAGVMTACQSKEEPPQEPPISTEAGEGQEENSEAQNSEQNSEQASENTCTITIQDFCTDKQFEIESGDTVYDVLKKTEVDMGASPSGDGVFIDGINGKYAGDEGETSGWIYTVNGEKPDESSDKYEVKPGDVIVWEYVTE